MRRATMTQKVTNLLKKVMNKDFIRKALADEAEGNPDPANTGTGASAPATSEADLMKNPTVTNLIQNARTEEKNKLHQQIENLKGQLSTEKANAVALATQLGEKTNEITSLNSTIERIKLESTASADDTVKALKTELATKDNQINALTGDVQALQMKYASLELTTYKQAKIAEAGGQLIEELVTGSTMDEIDNSIIVAKNVYSKYAPQSSTPPQGNPVPQSNPAPITNPTPSAQTAGVELSNLNVMTSKQDRKLYAEALKTTRR
jgi:hypothetical protein